MLYTGIVDMPDRQYVYVSSVPYDSEEWENNNFLVPIPKNSLGVDNLVANVLTSGTMAAGKQTVVRE